MKQKIRLHVRGQMLDLTSRISQRLLLTCRRNRRQGEMKGTIQVTTRPDDQSQSEVANTGTSGGVVAWSVGRQGRRIVILQGDFPAHSEPASSSSGPASVPGLPVTEGEFPIQQTPLPEPTPEPPVPDTAEDTDSDATVDYREREDSLPALAHGDDDVLIRLPSVASKFLRLFLLMEMVLRRGWPNRIRSRLVR